MTVEDACLVLGVDEYSLDEESLKRAFYNAAHLSHPDSNPENAYAQTKFAMIQEAYMVLKGYVFELPKYQKEDKAKVYTDPWDAYNEADRKFQQMKQEQKKRQARRAFQKRAASMKAASMKAASMKTASMNSATSKTVSSDTMSETRFSGKTGDVIQEKFLFFLNSDLVFDSILAGCVALLVLFVTCGWSAVIPGWMTAILLSRRVAKLFWNTTKHMLLSGIIFLTFIELIIGLMNLFLF